MNRPNSSPTRNRRQAGGDDNNNNNNNDEHQQQQHQQQQYLTNINKALNNAPSSSSSALSSHKNDAQSERSKRLAKELEDFVERGERGILATERGEDGAPSIEAATELQIQIARMFRQVCQLLSNFVLYSFAPCLLACMHHAFSSIILHT